MEKIGLVLTLLLALHGCSASDDRLHDLQRDLNGGVSQLRAVKVVEVKLPEIDDRERIVIINGRYLGGVCGVDDFGGDVRQEIDLRFGASEGAAAFLVLVSGSRVLDFASLDYSLYLPKGGAGGYGKECALIVKKENSLLRVRCEQDSKGGCNVLVDFGM